jgi:hypothetical protein
VAAPPAKQPALERQKERWEKENEGPGVYRLIKDYKVWRLVYQGEEAVLADERAVALVNYLLKNPPEEPIHGTELEVKVDGAPVGGGQVGGVIQEASGAQLNSGDNKLLKEKLRELKAASDDERLPESERADAAEELQKLLRGVAKVRRNGGQAGRVAERVRKALRRFIDELKVAEMRPGEPHALLRAFGQHLEGQLGNLVVSRTCGLRGLFGEIELRSEPMAAKQAFAAFFVPGHDLSPVRTRFVLP